MKHLKWMFWGIILFGFTTIFIKTSGWTSAGPTISVDHRKVVIDGNTVLSNDNDEIFEFFRSTSGLCDEANIKTTPTRRSFCTDRMVFKDKTRFASIAASPDRHIIGFTFESDELSPDRVVGVFYPLRKKDRVHFLTGYYLSNDFIGFSPSASNFVYRSGCWEGACAFYIKDSETLKDKINFIPPNADERGNYVFVRWLSDNKIEYKLDNETKQASF